MFERYYSSGGVGEEEKEMQSGAEIDWGGTSDK